MQDAPATLGAQKRDRALGGPGNAFRYHSEVNQLDGVEDSSSRRNRLRKCAATIL